jgi:hypothetical protein
VRIIYSFCTPEIGIHKPLILLIVACGIFRGFFHTNQLIVVFDRYRPAAASVSCPRWRDDHLATWIRRGKCPPMRLPRAPMLESYPTPVLHQLRPWRPHDRPPLARRAADPNGKQISNSRYIGTMPTLDFIAP